MRIYSLQGKTPRISPSAWIAESAAIRLNEAAIGPGCLVGAGALVTDRKTFAERNMIIGNPAKAIKDLTSEQVTGLVSNSQIYVRHLQPVPCTTGNGIGIGGERCV